MFVTHKVLSSKIRIIKIRHLIDNHYIVMYGEQCKYNKVQTVKYSITERERERDAKILIVNCIILYRGSVRNRCGIRIFLN